MHAWVMVVVVTAGLPESEPAPTSRWEHQVPEAMRATMQHATELEVFRLGHAPFEDAVCEPPKSCWQPPRWPQWKEGRDDDWTRDLLGRPSGTGRGILGYPVLAMQRAPNADLITRVRAAFSAGRYGGYTKFCGALLPAIGYRFRDGAQVIELLICFACREADLVMGDQVVRLQLDEFWRPLVELAIESFPNDVVLRRLRGGRGLGPSL